ncbi:hypothetical protein AGDE_17198 [Angomonas deanei]|nr:hypothetical protein AGDE_17198 [Angomonas deanei]|eukprot:EPY15063.1 hypothetical protein AGDE_17198 [Angomonas deanei]
MSFSLPSVTDTLAYKDDKKGSSSGSSDKSSKDVRRPVVDTEVCEELVGLTRSAHTLPLIKDRRPSIPPQSHPTFAPLVAFASIESNMRSTPITSSHTVVKKSPFFQRQIKKLSKNRKKSASSDGSSRELSPSTEVSRSMPDLVQKASSDTFINDKTRHTARRGSLDWKPTPPSTALPHKTGAFHRRSSTFTSMSTNNVSESSNSTRHSSDNRREAPVVTFASPAETRATTAETTLAYDGILFTDTARSSYALTAEEYDIFISTLKDTIPRRVGKFSSSV